MKQVIFLHLNQVDLNILLEIFDMANDLAAYSISSSAGHHSSSLAKDLLNFAIKIKEAAEASVEENEFEGLSDATAVEELKLSLAARLFPNVSCYYQRYLNESKISQIYSQKST